MQDRIHALAILMQAYRVAGDVEGAERTFEKIGLGEDPFPVHILAALHASRGNLKRCFPYLQGEGSSPGPGLGLHWSFRIFGEKKAGYICMHSSNLIPVEEAWLPLMLAKATRQGRGSNPDVVTAELPSFFGPAGGFGAAKRGGAFSERILLSLLHSDGWLPKRNSELVLTGKTFRLSSSHLVISECVPGACM